MTPSKNVNCTTVNGSNLEQIDSGTTRRPRGSRRTKKNLNIVTARSTTEQQYSVACRCIEELAPPSPHRGSILQSSWRFPACKIFLASPWRRRGTSCWRLKKSLLPGDLFTIPVGEQWRAGHESRPAGASCAAVQVCEWADVRSS